jgi:hypothetical protein
MVDRDKIIEMLSRGYSQTVVSAAVGCTDGYISQVVADPEVRDLISAKRLEVLSRRVEADDSIDDLETKALKRLHQLIPMIIKPMEALRVFEVANKATRKTKEPVSADTRGTIVNIVMPEIAAVHFKLSSDRQVVEVEGRSMATLPSQQLNQKLSERQIARVPQITDASSALEMLNKIQIGVPKQQVRNVLISESVPVPST